jgi:PBP1b-binding outer membrane lipoprotein LpoB
MKKYIFIVLLLLIVVGCSQQNGAEAQDEIIENQFPPSIPGIIIIDETEYEMEVGNYRWKRKQGLNTEVIQTDAASPNQIAEHYEAIILEQNSKIDIMIENNLELLTTKVARF